MSFYFARKWSKGWFEVDEQERLSLEMFRSLIIQQYTPFILEALKAIEEQRAHFGMNELLPFQCRKTIDALLELKRQFSRYCELLNNTSALPIVMLALRYRILDEFHILEEITAKLIVRIDRLIAICMDASGVAVRQEQAIRELLDELLSRTENVIQQMDLLLSEAKFQEKRLNQLPFSY